MFRIERQPLRAAAVSRLRQPALNAGAAAPVKVNQGLMGLWSSTNQRQIRGVKPFARRWRGRGQPPSNS
jgi:hypothetical protein